jgi:hypothetical protein
MKILTAKLLPSNLNFKTWEAEFELKINGMTITSIGQRD